MVDDIADALELVSTTDNTDPIGDLLEDIHSHLSSTFEARRHLLTKIEDELSRLDTALETIHSQRQLWSTSIDQWQTSLEKSETDSARRFLNQLIMTARCKMIYLDQCETYPKQLKPKLEREWKILQNSVNWLANEMVIANYHWQSHLKTKKD